MTGLCDAAVYGAIDRAKTEWQVEDSGLGPIIHSFPLSDFWADFTHFDNMETRSTL
jgi:hypothetical protein